MRRPLPGLFGADVEHLSPAQVTMIDAELTWLGKPHEFHRSGERQAQLLRRRAALVPLRADPEGWRIILDFYSRNLRRMRS